MKKSQRAFDKTWQKAESYPANVSPEEIRQLSTSKDGHEKLLSLFLMRRRIREGDPASMYFPLARQMVHDSDGHCRWQAAIVVGENIETDPDAVWQVVLEHGDSEDEDMRMTMACVLLEHLLESYFEKYFSLLKAEVVKGRLRFLDTLGRCWTFGQFDEKRVSNYIRNATRGLPNKRDLLR